MGSRPDPSQQLDRHWRANLRLTSALFAVWLSTSFGCAYFAPELSTVTVWGWPLGFYMCAQGSLIVFIALVAIYAWQMKRLDRLMGVEEGSP